MKVWIVGLAVFSIGLAMAAELGAQPYDTGALAKFRADRETALKADNGWLTVAGLHFLNPGENRIGSDPTSRRSRSAATPRTTSCSTIRACPDTSASSR